MIKNFAKLISGQELSFVIQTQAQFLRSHEVEIEGDRLSNVNIWGV